MKEIFPTRLSAASDRLATPFMRVIFLQRAQPGAGANTVFSVQQLPFGVTLNFSPIVHGKGAIMVNLATQVSEVAPGLGSNGFPGFLERSAQTTVELPSGASFAIAGLLQEDIQETVEGVPALKEAPIIGQLFRSQSFQSRQSELVIIATPYLVEPSTLAELTDPGEGFQPPTLVQSVLLGQLESSYGITRRGVGEARLQGPIGFILD